MRFDSVLINLSGAEERLLSVPCYMSFFTMPFPSLDSFAASRTGLQEQETETEVDGVFWKTRIVPILHELEKGKTIVFVLNKNFAFICVFPIALIFSVYLDYYFCGYDENMSCICIP